MSAILNPFGGPTIFYKNKETEKKYTIKTKNAIGGVSIAEEVLFLFILERVAFIVILLNRKELELFHFRKTHI